MTFKQKLSEEKLWYKKVMIIELYHYKMILKKGHKWKLKDSARSLRISMGRISEDLNLSKNLDEVIDCSSRKSALMKMRLK